jgi:hypothetical protein
MFRALAEKGFPGRPGAGDQLAADGFWHSFAAQRSIAMDLSGATESGGVEAGGRPRHLGSISPVEDRCAW